MSVMKCETAVELVNELFKLEQHEESLVFRGQGDSRWGLSPKLLRIKEKGFDHKAFEDSMLRQLREGFEMTTTIPERLYRSNHYCMAVAQHYGATTRLLDFTYSPLVAAYFACSDGLAYPRPAEISVFVLGDFIVSNSRTHGDKLTVVRPATGGNENLGAQRGLFCLHSWDCVDLWEDSFNLHVESAVESLSSSIDSRLTRLDLPVQEADNLLEMIGRRGVTGARLFPGMTGLTKTASDWSWFQQA